MAGHSKWANIQHRKARVDAARGKLFTRLVKEITVAARLGGGDPDGNPRLRAAIQDARNSNVPNDNIDRAIKKGTGDLEGVAYEECTLEGYGPGGVAMLVEAVTDNRNRTVAEVRHLFSRAGGSLGESGCVAWMFERQGYFALDPETMSEEQFMELALDLGADDIETSDEAYEIYTSAEDYMRILEELEKRQIAVQSKDFAMVPNSTTELDEQKMASVANLVDTLEEHDDVQNVWFNADLPSDEEE
ncbi:MAG: YebC/PmpR family DNA-binding transcriptional regulator [Acidobacteriota bacterium]|nr:YebC/PmpR family DNA-binding transcriptional regulator [Acidobacteriota bacterium]